MHFYYNILGLGKKLIPHSVYVTPRNLYRYKIKENNNDMNFYRHTL